MTQAQLIHQTLHTLAYLGVREVCVAAGARNAPLVSCLLASSNVKIWNFFEERSAAFFALGRIMADRQPVAVLTTSGTAAAELLPATIEAHYQNLPLILVTADRPKSYRGSGAPQAIEQAGLFGVYATIVGDWDAKDESPHEGHCSDGPMHLNVCLDEPLDTNVSGIDFSSATMPATPEEAPSFELQCDLVLAAGLSPADATVVAPILAALGAPIIAEATANLHGFPELQPLLIPGGEQALQSARPSHVLRIGAVPSWRWWRDLESLTKVKVTHITRTGFSGLARTENVQTLPWACIHSIQLSPLETTCGILRFEPDLNKFPQSEPAWVGKIASIIPAGSRVFLGNSLPIREFNLVLQSAKPGVEFFSNRGANGIDGLTSTFLGTSAMHKGESWLILGDLSALYDLAAPWIISQLDHPRLRIVIINNGGGKVIENRHTMSFEPWAQLWGMEYHLTEDVSDLEDLLPMPIVIEIRPDALETEAFWKDWQRPVIRPR
ncbi:2-succinyl-5-enolpyruvyl-6-hydroxy-3-cyclohexene-1-carboxylic-acid synthase [Prosthecobacter sp.]|uniref:2-succinyl-5-enolpyruvyl-6-hydroxy-3- cyclohexene-1-carboxylic-acid synthase n=1 Tax=Prosthecobacter sp. TaxID=1965333 RepID=UPI0037843320